MSNSSLIPWINFILFGEPLSCTRNPPSELDMVLVKMEVDKINWEEIGRKGGLTLFPYHVHSDLDTLLNHLEKFRFVDRPPTFRSGTITRFFTHLSVILMRTDVSSEPLLPEPYDDDDAHILNALLMHQRGTFSYRSASFWGELARRLIQQRRPLEKEPQMNFSSDFSKRAVSLYEMTCRARGQLYDPFTLHMVPHREHVDAVHWQSGPLLEAFVRKEPKHRLSRSFQQLLKRSIDEILNGKRPTALVESHPQLDSFLANVDIVHEEIPQVHHHLSPPKTIDVFQRTLALADRDHLWQTRVVPKDSKESFGGLDLLNLTERLLLAERQNLLLMQHVPNESSRM